MADVEPRSDLLGLLQAAFYATGVKQTDVAVESGYTEKHVSQMLHGKAGTLTAWDGLIRAAMRLHDQQVVEGLRAKWEADVLWQVVAHASDVRTHEEPDYLHLVSTAMLRARTESRPAAEGGDDQ